MQDTSEPIYALVRLRTPFNPSETHGKDATGMLLAFSADTDEENKNIVDIISRAPLHDVMVNVGQGEKPDEIEVRVAVLGSVRPDSTYELLIVATGIFRKNEGTTKLFLDTIEKNLWTDLAVYEPMAGTPHATFHLGSRQVVTNSYSRMTRVEFVQFLNFICHTPARFGRLE